MEPGRDGEVHMPDSGIYLLWIPLGAGGSGFVRMNGRIYEGARALREQRQRLDLFHTALEVLLPDARYVIESTWPQPDNAPAERGVVAEGPVFARWLSFTRIFRYEVRCWRDGVVPDAEEAIGGRRLLTDDEKLAERLLRLTGSVPVYTWGRDALDTGEMWNSNSAISWLVTSVGLPIDSIHPPAGGRAPGWRAGVVEAQSDLRPTDQPR